MNVLIDTQILVWIQEGNTALSSSAHAALTNTDNVIYVAQISLFEIAIKLRIGKLPAFKVTVAELTDQISKDGIRLVQLANSHIAVYDQIPLFADHRDPFDRLILATALAEGMPLISADEQFSRYRDIVDVIW